MAEKKTIELEIKSNVGESIADLKALKRQLKDTAAGSEDFKKLYNQIDDLEDKIKSSKNASSDWIDSLESAGGPLGMVGGALNKAKVATQSFGGALKATGIGLFVSLIGGLVAAFQDNENAMKKLQPLLDGIGKIFNGVFRAVEPLFNTLVDLAVNALPMVSNAFGVVYASVTAVFQSLGMLGSSIKKLISGDFSGAWKDAKSSVNDFSKNYDDSISRFIAGTKEVTKVEKKEGQTRVTNKKETNDELDKLNQERLANDMQSAKDAMAILDELAKAKETPAQKELREYEARKKILLANNLDITELTNQFLTSQADAEYAIYQGRLAVLKEQSDKEIEVDLASKEAKRNALDTSLNILQQFAGKNKAVALGILAVQKGLAIADIVVNAAKSIGGQAAGYALADANALATLGPVAGSAFVLKNKVLLAKGIATTKIGAATSIASILAAGISGAKSITGGGGGGATDGGGGSTPATAPPAFNVVGASPTNQLAQTIGNQQQQPIKTYVLSNDVTTAQGLERNIIQSASIG